MLFQLGCIICGLAFLIIGIWLKNSRMMDTVYDLYKDHDLNNHVFEIMIDCMWRLALWFMALQIMGIMFTKFGMYKCMIIYTSVMWSGTILIIAIMSITFHNWGFIEQDLQNEARRYWTTARFIFPERIQNLEKENNCCGWHNVFDYCEPANVVAIIRNNMAAFDMEYTVDRREDPFEPLPTNDPVRTLKTTLPELPVEPAAIISNEEDSDLDYYGFDMEGYGQYSDYSSNSNSENPDYSYELDNGSFDYGTIDYGQLNYRAGTPAPVEFNKHSFELFRTDESKKSGYICRKIVEESIILEYETEVCYKNKATGKSYLVNQVCQNRGNDKTKICHLDGCEEKLMKAFYRRVLPWIIIALVGTVIVSATSLIFTTQLAYNFRRFKSDWIQFQKGILIIFYVGKTGLINSTSGWEKLYVEVRQFCYEYLICRKGSIIHSLSL